MKVKVSINSSIDLIQINVISGELHIFQCVSHNAINIVEDIQQWMRHFGSNQNNGGEPSTQPNVNVKEAVSVFNQIAAQREKLVHFDTTQNN